MFYSVLRLVTDESFGISVPIGIVMLDHDSGKCCHKVMYTGDKSIDMHIEWVDQNLSSIHGSVEVSDYIKTLHNKIKASPPKAIDMSSMNVNELFDSIDPDKVKQYIRIGDGIY